MTRGAVRLSAIVVALGKETLLGACLSNLERALARVDGNTELIVVQNDAPTVGRERPRLRSPATLTVAGAPELGFAGGVAAALELARGEWVALVNDDCMVRGDALEELLAVGEAHPAVGSVAAQVVFAGRPDMINSAGIEIDELGVARERALGTRANEAPPAAVAVFGASAAFGLYRRTMLDSLAGLDVSFFAYLEDADLAWRAQMAGWSCLLAPRAIAVHHHSSTLGHGSREKQLLVGRNRVRMLAKNASGHQLRGRLIQIVIYDLLYVAYVAVADRSLAPLVGRLRGVGEWRTYRSAGGSRRRELALAASPGIRDALRRNRIYRSLPNASEARSESVEPGARAGAAVGWRTLVGRLTGALPGPR